MKTSHMLLLGLLGGGGLVLDAPVPDSPADEAELSDTTPAFVFTTDPNATSWRLQIDQQGDSFASLVINVVFDSDDAGVTVDGTEITYVLQSALDPLVAYEWRVAVETPVVSDWSETRQFDFTLDTMLTSLTPNQWLDETGLLWQNTAGSTPADEDGERVARWDDRSGNGNHVQQSTDASRMLYRAGNPRLVEGNNTTTAKWLQRALDGTAWTGITLMIVVRPQTADHGGVWSFADTRISGLPLALVQRNSTNMRFYVDNGYRWTIAHANDVMKAYILRGDGTTWDLWVNGVQQASYTGGLTNLANAQNVYINSGFTGQVDTTMDGQHAEIVLFNSALAISDIQTLAPLLNAKWGL